jgi:nicotinamide riboside kinase
MEKLLGQHESDIIKVVIFGPESTGKTTISTQLARHYHTVWAPEFARNYLQDKWNNERKTCENSDLLPIAIGQMALENDLSQKANEILICDTDILETKVYSETYYGGFVDNHLEKHALRNTYDLYFLTYIDVPWEEDDLRDRPGMRIEMFNAFKETLDKYNRPYILLKGDKHTRLKTAVTAIEKLKEIRAQYSKADLKQFREKGISVWQINEQIELFKNGISFSDLQKPATINDGIITFSNDTLNTYASIYETAQKDLDILKFVPASGAATRMFKDLFEFIADLESQPFDEALQNNKIVQKLLANNNKFPFNKEIALNKLETTAEKIAYIKAVLAQFSTAPKGLIPFHKYTADDIRTPFEEQLVETIAYAKSKANLAKVHFTIAEKASKDFKRISYRAVPKHDENLRVYFSYQYGNTDTVAVDYQNQPVRDELGEIIFRPAGHGALLTNLNEQDADIIFIKNIDNIAKTTFFSENTTYKKALAGKLIDLRNQVFDYLKKLENDDFDTNLTENCLKLLKNDLNFIVSDDFDTFDEAKKKRKLAEYLNRPIRICGMVKNEGEPGGGPFWVKNNGHTALQIVEGSQIDLLDDNQKEILDNATHFNPVDLVCSTRDYKGKSYNLFEFVAKNTAFISQKTIAGNPIQALELPGLWNGAMADWHTIFVAVPLETFNPVKTVVDLLKPAHQ